jgi:RNA polymerase-binding protein DksA
MTAPTVSSTAPTPHAAGIPPELREHLAQQLGEQRANLLARVNRLGVDIEALHTMTATRGQGETEHSSSETERAVVEQLEAGTREALEDIAYALARIDDGSYGLCSACGVPIGTDRLVALPHTSHCISCAR